MELLKFDHNILSSIHQRFLDENLIYGSSNSFESLLSPCLPLISSAEINSINDDFYQLWGLYRIWSKLYLDIKKHEPGHWLVKLSCAGLKDYEIDIQDKTIQAEIYPKYGRIDYLNIGKDRKIAEIQWRSGGPGLLVGIHEEFLNILDERLYTKYERLNLPDAIFKIFTDTNDATVDDYSYCVVNDISNNLVAGEKYLSKNSHFKSIKYIPLVREHAFKSLKFIGADLFCDVDSTITRVNFLHGYGILNEFSREQLLALSKQAIDEKIWVESPLNFIYRQKWGMALPFMKEYAGYFSDQVRDILCPSILLNAVKNDYSILIPSLKSKNAEMLMRVKTMEDLVSLPRSLREELVVKCGSGEGQYHTKSKGVFRLDGTKSHTVNTLSFIANRMANLNEPWLLQPFVETKRQIPFINPLNPSEEFFLDARSRYLIFGTWLKSENSPRMVGGLANYGKYWKVNGRSSSKSKDFREWGASFVPIAKTFPTSA